MSTWEHTKKVLFNRRGQSVIEYILILFIVVLIVSKFKGEILGKVKDMVDKTGQEMDNVMKDQ